MQAYDFSKDMVSATSTHVTLNKGDKVVWRKVNRRYGAQFDIRCTVVKATPQYVRVLCRWVDRLTGNVETDERNAPRRCVYRYDWPERQQMPAETAQRVQAKVLAAVREMSEAEALDADLAIIRQGITPIVRLTDEQMTDIESERPGEEIQRSPWAW
jgi:hypothetical protein